MCCVLTKAWRQTGALLFRCNVNVERDQWSVLRLKTEDDHYTVLQQWIDEKRKSQDSQFTFHIHQICCAYKRAQFASLISLFACNVVNWFDEWFQWIVIHSVDIKHDESVLDELTTSFSISILFCAKSHSFFYLGRTVLCIPDRCISFKFIPQEN